MRSYVKPSEDPRILQALDVIYQLAAGNLEARGAPSDRRDDLDAIIVGVNMLAEEFSALQQETRQHAEELERRVEERTAALRDTRNYLENLLDYANAPVIVWDPASRITRFNHAFEYLTGYTAVEVIGRELSMLFPAVSRDESLSKIARTSGGEYWESVEIPILCKNGETRIVLWNSANIYAEDGATLLATIAQGQDITGRKQAEDDLRASEERFRRAVLDSPFPIMLHAEDGVVLLVSNSWYEISGYSPDELATISDWTERAYGERRALVQAHIDRLYNLDHRVADGDYAIRTRSGETRIWAFNSAPLGRLPDGRRLVISMAMDVTEQRKAEAEVRELNKTLERRIAERTTQLQAANQELEAFAYSVSHDLRAPLRAMDGFSAALISQYQAQLDEQGRHYLERIQTASQRMGQLIDDLLNLSRVSRAEFSIQPVNLSALAREIAAELRARQPQRQADILVAEQLEVQGDASLLRVALQNLLDNAWKFTAPRPQARIEVGVREQSDGRVYFVRDNGVGFNMAYADKLFTPFQRLHTVREFPGTGIGLVTVQRIIHRHGGRVWAQAALDQGTTFYFTLGDANE